MLSLSFDKFCGQLVELLAPARCHFCATPAPVPVCASCAAALPWNRWACRACAMPLAPTPYAASRACAACLGESPPQDRTWAAFTYRAPIASQIVDLKFHGRLAPAHVLGYLMATGLTSRPEPLPDLLIPVPLHTRRLRRRGYNQALELAREISRRLSVTLCPDAAVRQRATREQTRLDATERRRNLRGAFAVADRVRGRHIALVDDVVTTGATVAELAGAAREAGAAYIEVWAAARAV